MNIYIGNMAFDTTEDQLRQAFEGFGEVSSVRMITDRDSGKAKGFAFVEMPGTDEAKAAVAGLKGHELNGRTLTVDEAKPRAESNNVLTGNREGGNHYRKVYQKPATHPRTARDRDGFRGE
ncbi:MAG: RNA-binding protein [candidate division Zixibacteria bacterium]|nr:RNA-binding protein [candidate division Zixibacteria bacterium]MDH3938124.1 RNA-binding protein [candidate division Zixibacteria bacterium]MDH4032870.1 RNA-binding protein [candidate division Zixibacteria bacterium]